jgi:maltose O-acetyltransferase
MKQFSWIKRCIPNRMKNGLLAVYWSVKSFSEDFLEYLSEILVANIPNHTTRLVWYRLICRMQIGKGSSIHRRCRFFRPERISIGGHSVINYGVLLDGRSGLVIGNNVSISEGVVILTLGHDIDSPDFRLSGGQVIIEDYVFIGSYARVLPGVTIKKGAVVGVGAVVTKDVEAFTLVGGIPARYIRDRVCDPSYELYWRKRFG